MRIFVSIAALAFAAACSPPQAEKAGDSQQAAQQNADAERPAIDPEAMAALERMGAYLRTLQTFELHTQTTTEEITADTAQKLQFAGSAVYRVRRPAGFFVETRTDRKHRQFFYDGSTFTIYSPRMHFYAQTDAPETNAATIQAIEDRLDIHLPLTDLFYWGTPEAETSNITEASVIGPATIDGVETGHYAFRQGDVDWQIWIERGDRPLPRKIVITTTTQPEQPQYTAVLDWTVNPTFRDAIFAFTPGADARRIQFAENQE